MRARAQEHRVASRLATRCVRARRFYWASCVTGPLAFGLWLTWREAWGLNPIMHWLVVAVLGLCFVSIPVTIWINAGARRELVALLHGIVSSRDPSAVGWLLDLAAGRYALESARWSSDRTWATKALPPLLFAMGARGGHALCARHRRALCRIVSPWAYRWARYAEPAALIVEAIEAASRLRDPLYDRGIAALAQRRPRCVHEQTVVAAAQKYVSDRERRPARHASGAGPDGEDPRN